jgi:uncharacterized protein
MKKIYIPQLLKEIDRQKQIEINDIVPNFISLTPVKGIILVRHGGNFLEVKLAVETIVTLGCDRCLQQYNHRLSIDTSEIIWLDDRQEEWDLTGNDLELEVEDLSETLPPEGHFDTAEWLFEQLSLALPLRNLCDRQCQATPNYRESDRESNQTSPDKRWAALNSWKQQLADGRE